jgi:tripartite ATP-independent transporter DctP family solute receptor
MMSKLVKIGAEAKGGSTGRALTRRSTLKGGLVLGAGATLGTFAIIGNASAAPVTMRFGSDSPIDAPHTKSAVVMKELVERGTDGRVEVTIFPDAQLGSGTAMTNAAKAGTLDAVVIAVSILAPAVPEVDVYCLPFLYKDTDEVLRIAKSPFGAQLTPKVNEAFACEVVGYTTDGSMEIWSRKRPIKTPGDLVGMKMGISSSKIQRDTMLAFGAIPTVMGMEAFYTALQTGLLDGTTKTRPDVINVKLYQVLKYLTLGNLYTMPVMMLVSKKFLEKLSPADQEVVRAAGVSGCDAQKDAVLASEQSSLPWLKQKGIELVPIEDIGAFREKVGVVYKQAGERIGAELVAAARKLATS